MQDITRRYLVVCLLLAGAAVARPLVQRRAEAVEVPRWQTIPERVGRFRDEIVPPDRRTMEYLGALAMVARRYTDGVVTATVSAIFGTQWRSLHSPAGCYVAQGWSIVEQRRVDIPFEATHLHPGPLEAEELLVRRDGVERVVVYLFAYPGGTTASWVEQCWKTTKIGRGGIVVLAEATVPAGVQIGAVSAAVRELVARLYPYFVEHWYRG